MINRYEDNVENRRRLIESFWRISIRQPVKAGIVEDEIIIVKSVQTVERKKKERRMYGMTETQILRILSVFDGGGK